MADKKMKISPRTRAIMKGYAQEDEEYPAGMDCHGHVWSDCEDAEYVDERYEESMKEIKKLKAENEKLQEQITCLESDSHNEVSQAEFDDMKESLEEKVSIAEADAEEEATLSCKLLEENKKLKIDLKNSEDKVCELTHDLVYAESEVARYSNALELEYVQIHEYDEMKEQYESQIKKIHEKYQLRDMIKTE